MSSINKTTHYNLSQFGDSPDDKPSWRGDYTADMSKIDSQMFRNATDATTATSTANTAKATADSALSLAQSNKADVTGDEEVVKTLLGDNTVDAATTSRTKWDNAASDSTGSRAALTALDAETAAKATTAKAKWDKASTDATANGAALTALGTETAEKAAAAKTRWDKASVPAKLKDYVVVLGDSWVDGYYSGAKHIDQSPAVAIKNRLNPTRFYYKGSSAGGFAVIGNEGRFVDLWDGVPDKGNVSAVIIIGGQNDATGIAQNKPTEAFVTNCARSLMESIHRDAPNAEIHVCPMVLAVGQTLTGTENHGAARSDRLGVYRVLTLNLEDMGYDYVRVHEGGYRIGVVASQGEGGGDGGDGVHLNGSGYVLAGNWIAYCVAADCDLWPTNYATPDDSQILGTWDYVNIFERDGMLHINYKCEYTSKPTNGNRIFKLPTWASIGNPQYFSSWDGKCFMALDGNTLSVQSVANMDATGTLAGSLVVPAGF